MDELESRRESRRKRSGRSTHGVEAGELSLKMGSRIGRQIRARRIEIMITRKVEWGRERETMALELRK